MQVEHFPTQDNRQQTQRELDTRTRGEYRVSAIVSIYKSEHLLEAMLEDLFGQTLYQRGELEIVLVDSASPQNEWAQIERAAATHDHIRAIRTSERESLYTAWNRGIWEARGRYLTNANTDDRHRRDALEVLAGALDTHRDVQLIYADQYVSRIQNETFDQNDHTRLLRPADYFAPSVLLAYPLGPQPMWRREVHEGIGYFNGDFKGAGDYDFALRFATKYRALHLPEALGLYYVGEEAISFRDNTMERENERLVSEWHTTEAALRMYAAEGQDVATARGRAACLTDMGLRALRFYRSWNYGSPSRDLPFALECFQSAAEEDASLLPALNNAALALALHGAVTEARALIETLLRGTDREELGRNLEVLRAWSGPADAARLAWLPSGLDLPSEEQLFRPDIPRVRPGGEGDLGAVVHGDAAPSVQSPSGPLTIVMVASVGVIDPRGSNAGLERAMLESSRALARRGHRVALVGQFASHAAGEETLELIEFRDWAAGSRPEYLAGADVVAFASGPDLGLERIVPSHVPKVMLFHHQEIRFLQGADPMHLLEQVSDRVICVTDAVRRNLRAAGVKSDKLAVVHNGVDAEVFHPRDVPRDPWRILFSGAFVAIKNPETLVQAFLQVQRQEPRAELHLYGARNLWDSKEARYNSRGTVDPATVAKLSDRIHFHGVVPQEQLAEAYSRASIIAMPSRFESFSLVSLEAQLCGCVPLAARTGGLPETMQEGVTGFLYEPNDASTLARELLALLRDPERVRRASRKAPEFVREHFSWEKTAQGYEREFRAAIEAKRDRRPAARTDATEARATAPAVPLKLRHPVDGVVDDAGAPEVRRVLRSRGWSAARPTTSIVIPCYNYARHLPEAVGSVVAQTVDDWEIVIVNDGSTDDSLAVARDLLERHGDRAITLIDQCNTGRPGWSRNAGIREARGRYILPLDADDVLLPDSLERFLRTARAAGGQAPVVVHGYYQRFGTRNDPWPGRPEPVSPNHLMRINQLPNTSLYARELWEATGGYSGMKGYEDWEFWIACARAGAQFELLPERMYMLRFLSTDSINHHAERRHEHLVAQIVMLHRDLYEPEEVAWARERIARPADAPRELHGPHDRHPKAAALLIAAWPKFYGPEEIQWAAEWLERHPVVITRGFREDGAPAGQATSAPASAPVPAAPAPSSRTAPLVKRREKSARSTETPPSTERPMRLLFVCHDYPPHRIAGAQLYAHYLARDLIRLGHEVEVFYARNLTSLEAGWSAGQVRRDEYEGVPVHEVVVDNTSPSIANNPQYAFENDAVERAFSKLLTEGGYDAVHFHLLYRLSARLPDVAREQGVPTVATLHDYWLLCALGHMVDTRGRECSGPETPSKCARCIAGFREEQARPDLVRFFELRRERTLGAIGAIDRVLSPSRFLADAHASHGYPRPEVLPLGWLPIEGVTRRKPDGKVVFGFCGQVVFRKGVDVMLKAFATLPPGNWELHIHGKVQDENYFEQLRPIIESHPCISYHGAFSSEQLPEIYSTLDVVVMPSRRENYPLTLLEALSAGVPAIAADVGGAKEILGEDGRNGYLFPNEDTNRLTAIVRGILEDPSSLDRLRGTMSRPKTIAENAREMAAIYRELPARSGTGKGEGTARANPEPVSSASGSQSMPRLDGMTRMVDHWLQRGNPDRAMQHLKRAQREFPGHPKLAALEREFQHRPGS